MLKYIAKRLLQSVFTLFVIITIIFCLLRLMPEEGYLGANYDKMSDVQRETILTEMGLRDPLPVQLGKFYQGLLRGDFGTSWIYRPNVAITEILADKAPISIRMGLMAMGISLVVGIPLGVLSAVKKHSLVDSSLTVLALFLASVPGFWLGLMLMIVFATNLKLLPSQGMFNVRAGYTGMRHMLDVLQHLILPCVTLVIITMPGYFRITKSSILQVTNEDFITTMRATGMSEKKIFNKYIFRNAILPTVTMFGISMAFLITGVSLIEIVFSWPGMGRLTLTAITQRDYPTLMGVYLVMSISVVIVMIITDIAYALLDPRIRYE